MSSTTKVKSWKGIVHSLITSCLLFALMFNSYVCEVVEGSSKAGVLHSPTELVRLVEQLAPEVWLRESNGDEVSTDFEYSTCLQYKPC